MKQPRHSLSVIFATITIVVIQGCVHEPVVPRNPDPDPEPITDEECDPDAVYFQNEVLPLLISNCAKSGCHDAVTAQDGIVLDSYAHIMGSDVIDPGDPFDSELYEKITEGDPDDVMPPPPATPLSSQQIAVIRDWILQGAKNTACIEVICDTTHVTFSNSIVPLVTKNCLGCHSGPTPPADLNFSTYEGVQTAALNGRMMGAITWSPGFIPMPVGGNRLSDCEIDMVRIWIEQGAPNN